jgi:hypothetical protein
VTSNLGYTLGGPPKQSSHLLVFLVDALDARNAFIEHQKPKCFLGEDHQTLIFFSQITYVLGVMEQQSWTKPLRPFQLILQSY